MRRLGMFGVVTAGWCLAGAWSCAADHRPYPPRQSSSQPVAVHAVHSTRLHAIMSTLGDTNARTWPQEIAAERTAEAEQVRAQRFEEARLLAAAMLKAAGEIPQAVADVKLEPTDRERFLAQVERLRTQAGELETSAAGQDFNALRATLHSVRDTCNGCHSQFRAIAGPIQLP